MQKNTILFTIQLFSLFFVTLFLLSSSSVGAATQCSGVVFPATDAPQCSSFCSAGGTGQHASWNAGGYTGAGGSGNCCCTGGTWDASARTANGSGGSHALPAGAATPIQNRGANVPTFDNPIGGKCSNNQSLGCVTDADCGAGKCQNTNIPAIAGNAIRLVLGIIGTIALVIFLYGGIQWMTALGDESKTKKGLDTMIWAGVGIIIIFGSYIAVQYLLKTVLGS